MRALNCLAEERDLNVANKKKQKKTRMFYNFGFDIIAGPGCEACGQIIFY